MKIKVMLFLYGFFLVTQPVIGADTLTGVWIGNSNTTKVTKTLRNVVVIVGEENEVTWVNNFILWGDANDEFIPSPIEGFGILDQKSGSVQIRLLSDFHVRFPGDQSHIRSFDMIKNGNKLKLVEKPNPPNRDLTLNLIKLDSKEWQETKRLSPFVAATSILFNQPLPLIIKPTDEYWTRQINAQILERILQFNLKKDLYNSDPAKTVICRSIENRRVRISIDSDIIYVDVPCECSRPSEITAINRINDILKNKIQKYFQENIHELVSHKVSIKITFSKTSPKGFQTVLNKDLLPRFKTDGKPNLDAIWSKALQIARAQSIEFSRDHFQNKIGYREIFTKWSPAIKSDPGYEDYELLRLRINLSPNMPGVIEVSTDAYLARKDQFSGKYIFVGSKTGIISKGKEHLHEILLSSIISEIYSKP